MLRIGICDDCEEQRKQQTQYLKKILEEQELNYDLFEFASGEELLAKYRESLDILFLDIELGLMNGIEVAKQIRGFDEEVKIIFTTVLWDYVREGYKVKAFRYILKPLIFDEYQESLLACLKELKKEKSFIFLNCNGNIKKVCVKEILYIETANRQIKLHTKKDVTHYYATMGEMEEQLKEYDFYRCHTGYIINLNYVKEVYPSYVIIGNDVKLPVSKYRSKNLKVKLLNILSRVIE